MLKMKNSHLIALALAFVSSTPSVFSQTASKSVIFMDSNCQQSSSSSSSSSTDNRRLPVTVGDFGPYGVYYNAPREIQIIDTKPVFRDYREGTSETEKWKNVLPPLDIRPLQDEPEKKNGSEKLNGRDQIKTYPDYTKVEPVKGKLLKHQK